MIWSSFGFVFQCEFKCSSYYVIWRPYFHKMWYGHFQASFFNVNSGVAVIISSRDHISVKCDMVIFRHHFSMGIQPCQWLCHLETIFLSNVIWSSPGFIFQCEFNCSSYYVIWRLYFRKMWYGHLWASFFNVNSTIAVIMSSGDYISVKCDMVIFGLRFSLWIQL